MNKAEPTAGEWKASGLGVYATVDGVYAGGIGRAEMEDAISYAEACRNADLFAASKDLLAACERTLATIEQCPDLRVRLTLLRAELQIAIAKAKGEM